MTIPRVSIEVLPGGNSGGGGGGGNLPATSLAFYADTAVVASGENLLSWHTANVLTGVPLYVADSVIDDSFCIRTSAASAISAPARSADFLTSAAATIA